MARQRVQSSLSNACQDGHVHRGRAKKRDVDEHEPTTDSQYVLAAPQTLKKPKGDEKEIKQFRIEVAADQHKLKALLAQRWKDAERNDTNRHNGIASLLAQAFQSADPQTSRITLPNTNIVSSLGSEHTDKMNTLCQTLLSDYTSFEAMITQMANEQKRTVTETWTQDVENMERDLTLGYKTALRHVKKVLAVRRHEDKTEEGDEGLNYELRNSLSYAERGVKRMVKGLPKDETK